MVVLGATGRQGGAVVDHLSKNKDKWVIKAISRNPTSPEGIALHARHPHVQIVKADALDKASLVAAFKGAYAVFGVTSPFQSRWTGGKPPETKLEIEEQQGHNIVDACKECDVKHLVFASVASAHENTGVQTFEAKAKIEKYLVASGVPHTVLGPVGFFENMESPFAGIKQGVIPGLLKHGAQSQMISTDDIGWFVVNALENPGEWLGRRFEIAGERLCADDMCATMSRLRRGEHWKVSTPPDFVFKLFIPKAVANLKKFLEEKGTHVSKM